MATKAHDCLIKANNTVCPECGRIVPDWCGKDQPVLTPVEDILTGSDLTVSIDEVKEANDKISALIIEQADADAMVFKKRPTRPLTPPPQELSND